MVIVENIPINMRDIIKYILADLSLISIALVLLISYPLVSLQYG
jgi:hypothetical protein